METRYLIRKGVKIQEKNNGRKGAKKALRTKANI